MNVAARTDTQRILKRFIRSIVNAAESKPSSAWSTKVSDMDNEQASDASNEPIEVKLIAAASDGIVNVTPEKFERVRKLVARGQAEARLQEAKLARSEFGEHFYGKFQSTGTLQYSNDPYGFRECLDERIAALEASLGQVSGGQSVES